MKLNLILNIILVSYLTISPVVQGSEAQDSKLILSSVSSNINKKMENTMKDMYECLAMFKKNTLSRKSYSWKICSIPIKKITVKNNGPDVWTIDLDKKVEISETFLPRIII